MLIKKAVSRRLFLKHSAGLSCLGVASPFALNLAALGAASATNASDYKALVCIFMYGGNDAYNTVLATDPVSWQSYQAVRNQQPDSIALLKDVSANRAAPVGSPAWLGGVLPLVPAQPMSRNLALHPMLTNVQSLYNIHRRLAVVANVGPLIEPLTKSDYRVRAKRIPAKLFSHNDQQNTWQAFAPEGAMVGWGGKLADVIAGANGGSMFTAVSATGNSVWLNGQTVKQYQVATSGATRLGTYTDTQGRTSVYNEPAVGAALERMVARSVSGHMYSRDISTVNDRAIQGARELTAALSSHARDAAPYGPPSRLHYDSPVTGGQVLNPLAEQLQIVSRVIAARATLGLKRQVFFVGLPGFDTHDKQSLVHADLMARMDHALAYFDDVLRSIGMEQAVTTFTASDFGRTFTSNGDGTDHGWGGHHFVMGGAVQGGSVLGRFPEICPKNSHNNDFDASADQLHNGALLPTTSVDQYGAALAAWMGVSRADAKVIFPNLGNFGDLGSLFK